MPNIKFSVVIPVYKTESVLKRSLESTLHQTYKHVEAVIVNDGSPTNQCDEIIKYYSKNYPNIRYIKHEKNEGLYMARKSGVLAATGECLLFLDSDDFLESNACEILCNFINERSLFHRFDYIRYPYRAISKDGTSHLVHIKVFGDELLQTMNSQDISLVNRCYRLDFLKEVYLKMKNFYAVDIEDYYQSMIIELYAKERYQIDTPLYNYYSGIGVSREKYSSDVQVFDKVDASIQNVYRNLLEFYNENGYAEYCEYAEKFIATFYKNILLFAGSGEIRKLLLDRQRITQADLSAYLFQKNQELEELVNILNPLIPIAKLLKKPVNFLRRIKKFLRRADESS